MSEPVVAFSGRASCRLDQGPYGLVLTGTSGSAPGEFTTVRFSGAAAIALPAVLVDARVEDLGGGRYLLCAAGQQWQLAARAVHVHRDAGREFYAALPPRPVPARRRLFWRLVLALAGSRAGLSILRSLRR